MNSSTGSILRLVAGLTLCTVSALAAPTSSNITLTTTPNPSVYGHPVTLTATLTGGGTGKVTFFDGVTLLETSTVTGTTAVLTTSLLGTGKHSLRAIYIGDASHLASTSAAVEETVNAMPEVGLQLSAAYNVATTDAGSFSLIGGDFNGDGKADIAFTAAVNSEIGVMLGNGDGTFQTPLYSNDSVPFFDVNFSFEGPSFLTPLMMGDFNGDGRPDLVFGALVTGPSGSPTQAIYVMIGNGDGTFQTPAQFVEASNVAVTSGTMYSVSLAVGDFNGDGRADVFHPPFLLLGNGDGTFQPAVNLANTAPVGAMATGDFNGDGIADVASVSGGMVSVQLGTGSGTFQAAVNYSVDALANNLILAADFNGDGKADLAVLVSSSSGVGLVSVLLGNGDGTFQTAVTSASGFGGGGGGYPIQAADFNGGGKTDLIVAGNNGLNLLLGNGDGTFQPPVTAVLGNFTGQYLLTGDFNGDGRVDLASSSLAPPTGIREFVGGISVYLGVPSTGLPTLAVTSVHTGTFQQTLTGTYTITVTNTGSEPTTLPVTATDNLPPGLTATAISGTGWTCQLSPLNCVRGDALAAGASYPAITVSVNVAANATTPQVNMVSVAGGGAPGASATDSTPILINQAALNITKTHAGNFTLGQNGAVYTVTVSNGATAAGPTSGTVTVTDTLPSFMTLVSMAGTGWNCPGSNACTRSDALAANASYPPITVTVNVAANALSPLTNQAVVSGGSSLSANASDLTTIVAASNLGQSITFGPLTNFTLGSGPFALSATASSGLPVSFASTTPAVCVVTGTTVTIIAAGTCSVTASQSGNSVYAAATPVTQTFTVSTPISLVSQTITFQPLSNVALSSPAFTLSATASSGLPVGFASATPAVCSVSGATLTPIAAGTCTITATQPGNATYSAAAPVTQSFTILSSGAPANFSELGIFRALGGSGGFWLDLNQSTYNYDSTAKFRFFGLPGDQPVAGDWDGTGVIRFGVFRQGNWYIDLNDNGAWDGVAGGDAIYSFGLPGDIAIPGDWGGTGVTKLGVFRCPPAPAFGGCTWYLDAGNKKAWDPATAEIYSYGLSGDLPVVNNWNGTGKADQVGVFRCPQPTPLAFCYWIVENVGDGIYRPSDPVYQYGLTGDLPVVGNWSQGPQRKRIGVFRSGMWILDTFGTNSWFQADSVANFGLPGDQPVIGFWTVP